MEDEIRVIKSKYNLKNISDVISVLKDLDYLTFVYYYSTLNVLDRREFINPNVFEAVIDDKNCTKKLSFVLNRYNAIPSVLMLKFGYKIVFFEDNFYVKNFSIIDLNRVYSSLLKKGKINIDVLSKILNLMDYKIVLEFINQNSIMKLDGYNLLIKNIMFKDILSINDYFNGDIEVIKLFNLDELSFFINAYKGDLNKIFNSKEYINYVSHITDPLFYRSIIYQLEDLRIDTYIIENIHRKYIRKYLDSYDDTLRDSFEFNLSFFNKCKSTIQIYRNYNEYIFNLIIEILFQDFSYNVLFDIKEIINLTNSVGINIINEEHLNMYKFIYRMKNVDVKTQMNFYKKYKDSNLIEMFYDDMKLLRDYTHKDLVDSSIDLNKRPELYNKELSDKYRVPVYYLNGEKFNAIIRCHRRFKNEGISRNHAFNIGLDGYSFSMISDRNITTFNDPNLMITLVYSDIDSDYIAHVSNSDSYSKVDRRINDYETKKINKLYTSDLLMDNTFNFSFNELVIMANERGIKPTAVLCYDNITIYDINLANEFKIPILLINSKSYIIQFNSINRNTIEYVRSSDDLKKILS